MQDPITSTHWTHSEPVSRLVNGSVALVLAFLAQFLIAGIEYLLGDSSVDFPPSILAMALVFMLFSVCGCILPGTEALYRKRLRCAVSSCVRLAKALLTTPLPALLLLVFGRTEADKLQQADLLNRHMSIGFTIPFVMICRTPVTNARALGLVVACFRMLRDVASCGWDCF